MITFHGDDVAPCAPDKALFHVIPVPYEASVSYGHGTARGPLAILEASAQLELFDGKSVPADKGIYTAGPVNCEGAPEAVFARIEQAVARALSHGAIPAVIGGEHSISSAVVKAVAAHCGRIGVVQFDAHADLRESYEGSIWSHASVMKRIHDTGIPIYQIGTRSYCLEEHELREKAGIPHVDAERLHAEGLDAVRLPADFPEHIFITFDIDALDGALMPATGTPVPGGLTWYQAKWLLERLCLQRKCVGFDVVEFAPIPSLHAHDFAAAQLVYNIMGCITRGR
ncbi:MAG: agmatinase [Opitutales bacterium]|jgi:agmatinase